LFFRLSFLYVERSFDSPKCDICVRIIFTHSSCQFHSVLMIMYCTWDCLLYGLVCHVVLLSPHNVSNNISLPVN
jgi:hypothetical protein